MLLENKTAVITGSNKGIGLEILKNFSKNKANIFACARTIDEGFLSKIKTIKENYNNEIIPIELDLANENKVKEAANEILSFDRSIEILVNNAGTIQTSLFQMSSKKKLNEIFEINFFSQTIFTQFILKSMVKQGILREYAMLIEKSKAPVSQFEHTFVILEDEVVRTTG